MITCVHLTIEEVRVLVERAQRFDADAWEALYRHAYPGLHTFARRRLATGEQADDAVSETIARAIDGLERFVWTAGGFDGWLFGILRNVILESYRATARHPVAPATRPDGARFEPAGGDPGDRIVDDEDVARARRALAELDPDDRELIELRVIGRLDAEAVGTIVGRSAGAVRMAQSRALDRLRVHFREARP